MKIPNLTGVIDRRILVNYRLDPEVAATQLPEVFVPKVVQGFAIAGICLIRLKQIRPSWLTLPIGIGSENAAHRFAVQWQTPQGLNEGVYIPRRDTSSRLNALAGGRLFPGEHHHAKFTSEESGDDYRLAFMSDDGQASVDVRGSVSDRFTDDSVFGSLDQASDFFKAGSLGYSDTSDPERLDGLLLDCKNWAVSSLSVTSALSSYFEDESRFPKDSVSFDHALLMRGIDHQWRASEPLCCSK